MLLGIIPDSDFVKDSLYNKTAPLGLLSILSKRSENTIIYNEMVSGNILDKTDIVSKTEIVFITLSVATVSRAIKLSKHLKNNGKKIYWGGPEVTMNGPKLLIDHPYVDGIVVGPGESVIDDLLEGNDRSGRVFLKNNIDSYLGNTNNYKPKYSDINFKQIAINYSLLYDLNKYEGLSYLWGNDCSQANNRCYFCGRTNMGIGYRNPRHIWNELLEQYNRGFRLFYNTTDSVTTNLRLFEYFCNAKPAIMRNDYHRVFVNTNRVNDVLIRALRRINGIPVMGIESFSSLDGCGKIGITNKDNTEAIERLYKQNMRFVLSFVFGLPGETLESIEYNSERIKLLVDKYGSNIDSIHISPLLITTGSRAFYDLFKIPDINKMYSNTIIPLNAISLSEEYFARFCSISRNDTILKIFTLAKEIQSIAPHISVGAKGIEKKENISSNMEVKTINCEVTK